MMNLTVLLMNHKRSNGGDQRNAKLKKTKTVVFLLLTTRNLVVRLPKRMTHLIRMMTALLSTTTTLFTQRRSLCPVKIYLLFK